MEKFCTWGDELTLKYCADVFDVVIHVVTSHEENWYLHYDPAKGEAERHYAKQSEERVVQLIPDAAEDGKVGTLRKQIFLTYVAPVHYNSISLREAAEMIVRRNRVAREGRGV
jgi:hypothetical protein